MSDPITLIEVLQNATQGAESLAEGAQNLANATVYKKDVAQKRLELAQDAFYASLFSIGLAGWSVFNTTRIANFTRKKDVVDAKISHQKKFHQILDDQENYSYIGFFEREEIYKHYFPQNYAYVKTDFTKVFVSKRLKSDLIDARSLCDAFANQDLQIIKSNLGFNFLSKIFIIENDTKVPFYHFIMRNPIEVKNKIKQIYKLISLLGCNLTSDCDEFNKNSLSVFSHDAKDLTQDTFLFCNAGLGCAIDNSKEKNKTNLVEVFSYEHFLVRDLVYLLASIDVYFKIKRSLLSPDERYQLLLETQHQIYTKEIAFLRYDNSLEAGILKNSMQILAESIQAKATNKLDQALLHCGQYQVHDFFKSLLEIQLLEKTVYSKNEKLENIFTRLKHFIKIT